MKRLACNIPNICFETLFCMLFVLRSSPSDFPIGMQILCVWIYAISMLGMNEHRTMKELNREVQC